MDEYYGDISRTPNPMRSNIMPEGSDTVLHGYSGAAITATVDELAQHRIGALGVVAKHSVAAVGEAFELHALRRQVGDDLFGADDRAHRVVLTSQHEHRALRSHATLVRAAARSGSWSGIRGRSADGPAGRAGL